MNISHSGFLDNMAVIKNHRTLRISSWDRTGKNADYINIPAHEKTCIMDVSGAGCIRKIYFTSFGFDRLYSRKLIIRMYWDGEDKPSVEVPFGDFFGLGHCKRKDLNSLLLATNKGIQNSVGFNSYFPMPFGTGARIELENQGEIGIWALWFHIDYDEYDEIDNSLGRFHAQWRRENTTKAVKQPEGVWQGANLSGKQNYVILDAEGQGQYAGFILNVDNLQGQWWGEGDDMIFIDGEEWPPSYHGTGTEEIFGGGACPQNEYAGIYSGFHMIENGDYSGKTSMYRFFACDPIRFKKSICATIEHGHNNDFSNDYSSTAYWYQKEPHKEHPLMLPVYERLPHMPDEFWAVYNKECEVYKKYNSLDEISQGETEEAKSILTQVMVLAEEGKYNEALKLLSAL